MKIEGKLTVVTILVLLYLAGCGGMNGEIPVI